jgi:hypothetical protein
MANWFKHLSKLKPQLLTVLVIVCWLPIIGSRSIGGSLGSGGGLLRPVVVPTSESSDSSSVIEKRAVSPSHVNQGIITSALEEESTTKVEIDDGEEKEGDEDVINKLDSSGDDVRGDSSNPCALLATMALANQLNSFQQKSLISVSHNVFDVSHGIVPDILYSGKSFIL